MWIKLVERYAKCQSYFWIFNSKFEFKRVMYFTYLEEALGDALQRNSKAVYCGSDITDKIQEDNWHEVKLCSKY